MYLCEFVKHLGAQNNMRVGLSPWRPQLTVRSCQQMHCNTSTAFESLCTSSTIRFNMVLEAGYPSTTGFRKVVKATILVRKKPGLSDEAFIEHYNHKHAQMAAPVLQKHNVITYSLVGTFSIITLK